MPCTIVFNKQDLNSCVCLCVDVHGVCLMCQTYLVSLWISTISSKYATISFKAGWNATILHVPVVIFPMYLVVNDKKTPKKTEQTKWKSASFGMMTVSRPQHALTRLNAQWYCMECSDVYNAIHCR